MYTVIAENDESQWEDETGILYHFPKRYEKFLLPGTEVIYYKGKLKNIAFRHKRLSDFPHYFAMARIEKIYPDIESSKGDLFATITNFSPFSTPILAKIENSYLEEIPESRVVNYWRDGVRQIGPSVFNLITSKLQPNEILGPKLDYDAESTLNDTSNGLESETEGKAKSRFVTTYERNPKYRKQAIAIHGTSCVACGFNFGRIYGEYAIGFIHVHHVVPVSEFESPKKIDPETDLIPLCANCHSVVHRKKSETLSIKQLRALIESASNESFKQDK
jgi:predicted HNH restriction endonuclease